MKLPRTVNGCCEWFLWQCAGPDPEEPSMTLFIHGHTKRLPDGRPLLHVSVADNERAARMFPTPASRAAPMARWGGAGGLGQARADTCRSPAGSWRRRHRWHLQEQVEGAPGPACDDAWLAQPACARTGQYLSQCYELHSHTLLPPPSPMRPLLAPRGL